MSKLATPPKLKPPYRLPTMREVRRSPDNGLRVVSLFSGAGGSDLGFELAGFRTLAAVDFSEGAVETYSANFPGVPIFAGDVRTLTAWNVEALAGRAGREIDVLSGSPPCASFSMSARREKGLEKGWNQVKEYGRRAANRQRTDDLFGEFARLLGALMPRAFVAENVFGLVRGKAKGHFLEILARMKGFGYRVRVRELDAQWLGVPQVRRRVIFVGLRDDVEGEPPHPEPLSWRYSVREAFAGLPEEVPEPETRIEGYAIGVAAIALAPGRKSEKFFNLRRLHFDEPARTVLASCGHPGAAAPLHPNGERKPTIAELKRLCGFPDDFVLKGTYEQRWERLGRAVPPPMMRAVAEVLAPILAASPKPRS